MGAISVFGWSLKDWLKFDLFSKVYGMVSITLKVPLA